MKKKEEVLRSLQEKTDDEKRELLSKKFRLNWDRQEGSCKLWGAKVFTYCREDELEEELNFFLFLVNTFGYLWNICFNQEDTVFLGCICPRGNKQTILYYTITFED